MQDKDIEDIFRRYRQGKSSESEKAWLEQWVLDSFENQPDFSQKELKTISKRIYHTLPKPPESSKNFKLYTVLATVAAISLLGISAWLYQITNIPATRSGYLQTIKPGGYKATVSIDGGDAFQLNSSKKGIRLDGEQITYDDGTPLDENTEHLNERLVTISTPKGGEYSVVLSDGTKVWLNAGSNLRYKSSFRDRGNRDVELMNGEAYFEVAKDKSRPFIVKTGSQQVVVLGTHFNINAYDKAHIKTTLAEGVVKVREDHISEDKFLSPGQQAQNDGGFINVSLVDPAIAIAWKNGKIQFVREQLKPIMEMISRWYQIEVVYHYCPEDEKFTGSISRSKDISEVLSLLETTGEVHFKIVGRKVLVMK